MGVWLQRWGAGQERGPRGFMEEVDLSPAPKANPRAAGGEDAWEEGGLHYSKPGALHPVPEARSDLRDKHSAVLSEAGETGGSSWRGRG